MRKLSIVMLGILIVNLSACAKRTRPGDQSSSEYGAGETMQFYGSNTEGVGGDVEGIDGVAKNTYYFGYDSYNLTEQDSLALMAYAKKLVENPNSHIRIEGHTDERGSREYNIALGERRAKAITNILLMKGVSPNQISVVSYGKEKPANMGHEESSWSLNRRGVLENEGA